MRAAVIVLALLLLLAACAGNPPPRDVEGQIAAEGLAVAAKMAELSNAVALAVKDGALSTADERIMRARLTGVNLKGKELGTYLKGMDSAPTPEAQFPYRKLAIDTIAQMQSELRAALKPLKPDETRHYYLLTVANEIQVMLLGMSTKLGVPR